MPLRSRHVESEIPEVNLIPMLSVLMVVLTFFIIISMNLTGQSVSNVKLPILGQGSKGQGSKPEERKEPKKLVFGLDNKNQLSLDSKTINVDQMAEEMVKFLNANSDGIVVLKADSKLTYDNVVKLLEVMRDVGGDRVSLAVDYKN
jgi:biopolymer transport protein ExbD